MSRTLSKELILNIFSEAWDDSTKAKLHTQRPVFINEFILEPINKFFKKETDYFYDEGCTKAALMFPEEKIVYKIPITENDCCEKEWDIYRSLDKQYQKFFLEITKVGVVAGIPIYCQPYALIHGEVYGVEEDFPVAEAILLDEINTFTSALRRKIYKEGLTSPVGGWLAAVWKEWGPDEVEKLFCCILNNRIDDLHLYNLGYISKEGKMLPVILDYGGFDDESDNSCDSWESEE